MALKTYKELKVWQKSIFLVREVYFLTRSLPRFELYVLKSQMCRAAISIPSNIAEGYKRRTTGEYVHFLGISDASAAELETQLILVKELYPETDCHLVEPLITEIQKMLTVLIRKLEFSTTP